MARYALLPYWYTLFYEAHLSGTPTMRPIWMEYPADAKTFAMDDEWLVGSDLLHWYVALLRGCRVLRW